MHMKLIEQKTTLEGSTEGRRKRMEGWKSCGVMDGNGRNDIERGKKYRKTRGGNLKKWMNVKNQQRAIAVCSEMEKTEKENGGRDDIGRNGFVNIGNLNNGRRLA